MTCIIHTSQASHGHLDIRAIECMRAMWFILLQFYTRLVLQDEDGGMCMVQSANTANGTDFDVSICF
jgi:hypothetical protein